MSFGEHTSKKIIGTKGTELKDRKIVLCITGSVAAIKSPEIARELMRHGAEVYIIMSDMAKKIIHPYMMEWSTGNPVITDLTGKTEHITLGGDHLHKADLVLVAPSTANTIGKVAAAIDDTPVTTLLTTAIGARIPIIIAPAMHASMYKHPFVIENVEKLRSIGVEVLMPRFEEDKAKIPSTEEIIDIVLEKMTQKSDYVGITVLVTGGPTREYLDGFRFISNPSSGKMGVEIAREAQRRGANVTFIYGPGTEVPPRNVKVIKVNTTTEMMKAVTDELTYKKYDLAILSAAAADFGPENRKMIKTSSNVNNWKINLIPIPKIIDRVKEITPKTILVGFKAEYDVSNEILIEKAKQRMRTGNMDIIVANDVSRVGVGFGTDTNEVFILDKNGHFEHLSIRNKKEIASKIISIARSKINQE